mgnify:CR=1 FL=1
MQIYFLKKLHSEFPFVYNVANINKVKHEAEIYNSSQKTVQNGVKLKFRQGWKKTFFLVTKKPFTKKLTQKKVFERYIQINVSLLVEGTVKKRKVTTCLPDYT